MSTETKLEMILNTGNYEGEEPTTYYPFKYPPDHFQKWGFNAINIGNNILVTAHTGAGKTALALYAIAKWLQELRVQKIPRSTIEANTLAMRELTREDGLGKFKVLIQEKNTGSTSQMISPDNTAINLPIPFLRSDHVKLMENKYPHTQWQLEELWQE